MAAKYYKQAAEANNNNIQAYYNLGLASKALEDLDAAEIYFRLVIEKSDAYPKAIHHLVDILNKTDRPEEARRVYSNFLQSRP